jgi:catechol-2,3-dioxygenase
MLSSLRWLTLETSSLGSMCQFYEEQLGLTLQRRDEGAATFAVGGAELRLHTLDRAPRGGAHTLYRLAVPPAQYSAVRERLTGTNPDVTLPAREADAIAALDPAGNCVEVIKSSSAAGSQIALAGLVLEVSSLAPARVFYERLGFRGIDSDAAEGRARLGTDTVVLDLWEPQTVGGGARGGVHVDWGMTADDPQHTAERVVGDATAVEEVEAGVLIRDPDGHRLTLCER